MEEKLVTFDISSMLSTYGTSACITIGAAVGLIAALKTGRTYWRNRQWEATKASYPKDTVILHGIGRGPYAPSVSPFPIKLETFLRIAKIPHQVTHNNGMSPEGKTPWMTFNGVDVSDSQLCIEYLKKKLDYCDLATDMSHEDRAIAHAFRVMIEDHLYWVGIQERWVDTTTHDWMVNVAGIPRVIVKMVSKRLRQQAIAQGMGRHSREDILHLGYKALEAISQHLGNKDYMMGDKPCELDCTLFGFTAQMIYHIPGTTCERLVIEEFPNLVNHFKRMRDNFWPDWNEHITHPPAPDIQASTVTGAAGSTK